MRSRVGALAASSQGFHPQLFGTVLAWWDMSKEGYSDAASITTVTDRSGNGNDLTAGAAKPVMDVDGINGYPAADFSASTNALASASAFTPSGISILAVFKRDSASGIDFWKMDDTAGLECKVVVTDSVRARATNGTQSTLSGSPAPSGAVVAILATMDSGGTVSLNVNNSSAASAFGAPLSINSPLLVGPSSDVRFGEMVVWDGVVSSAALTAAKAKWGIA